MNTRTRFLKDFSEDNRGFIDENSVAKAYQQSPTQTNSLLTFIMGKEEDKFPLTFLTEGQEGGVEEIDGIEFTWDVWGDQDPTDLVTACMYNATDKPGINSSMFYIVTKTNKFKNKHTISSPNKTRCRIMTDAKEHAMGFMYGVKLFNPDANAYIDPSELTAGHYWSMGIATVSESKSTGAYDNITLPGKRTNQISFVRKSYKIAGNVANARIKELSINTKSKGKLSMFMDLVEWDNTIKWKKYQEEHYWNSEYNRRENGEIPLRDEETGEPIPTGAGIGQICKDANYTSYGLTLPLALLKSFISALYNGWTTSDYMPEELVAYCGEGFMEDFDNAIKVEGNGYAEALGYEMIKNSSDGLVYGAYFKGYRLPNNKVLKLVHLQLLDKGTDAENDRKNGNVHPRTGRAMTSHSAYFVDHTTYDGNRNVKMYTQKGRAILRGVVKGMSPLPKGWGNFSNTEFMSTDRDESSLHFFSAKGINISNEEHCGFIECIL